MCGLIFSDSLTCFDVLVDYPAHRGGDQWGSSVAEEEGVGLKLGPSGSAGVLRREGACAASCGAAVLQIGVEGGAGFGAEEDDALLVALADDADLVAAGDVLRRVRLSSSLTRRPVA